MLKTNKGKVPIQHRENKCAFTLAETLITLVIIGVVAAITIPNLIAEHQKEQTVTKLKKAYSILSQTTQWAIADFGPTTSWEVGEAENGDDAQVFFNKYIAPYLILEQKSVSHAEGNWDRHYSYLNGHTNTYGSYYRRAYLNDGTSLTYCINETGEEVRFYIDINGDRKPNKTGRDIFVFRYLIHPSDEQDEGRIMPFGAMRYTREKLLATDSSYSCNKEKYGLYCSMLIMKDSWRIKKDYPW